MRDTFFIRQGRQSIPIRVEDVYYVQGLRNYIAIQTKKYSYKALSGIKEMEQELPAGSFCRVHRSFIVALNHIDFISRDSITIAYHVIPIGRARKTNFLRRLYIVYRRKNNNAKGKRKNATKRSSFFIRSDRRLAQIRFAEIQYMEVVNDFIFIHTKNKIHKVLLSMRQMENELPDLGFYRVHRSFIVASGYIDSINTFSLKIGDKEIPIGQNYKTEFLKELIINCRRHKKYRENRK